MTRLTPKGLDLQPVFNEVREMLHREVDYEAEAKFTRQFGERLKDDARFVVPQVISEYSSPQILTPTYEENCTVRAPKVRGLRLARSHRLCEADDGRVGKGGV